MPHKNADQLPESFQTGAVQHALERVQALQQAALELEMRYAEAIAAVAPASQASARNLVHYLAVRACDIRELQANLGRLGLSSLGRMEAHAMASLNLVAELLQLLLGRQASGGQAIPAAEVDMDRGSAMLAQHANAILGPVNAECNTRIMVTMPAEAADDPALINDLLAGGMQVMRINCAHDSPLVWARMLRRLRRAERHLGRKCKVSFDLAGPKLRTGPIEPAAGVVKWRPLRNPYGGVTAPALIRLSNSMAQQETGRWTVPINGALPEKARAGDQVEFVDARGRKRRLAVVEARGGTLLCHADRTAYLTSGIKLRLRRGKKLVAKTTVGELAPRAAARR